MREEHHPLRQVTSLKTKIFESSLDWDIEHFMEYSLCDVDELKSDLVEIKGFDSTWQLTVYPKAGNTGNVGLRFKIFDIENRSIKTLLKFEVRADPTGNEMLSPANHNLHRSRGPYAEPIHEQPMIWSIDYSPITEQQEFYCEDFINHEHLAYYLGGGTLTLSVNACVKTVEIVHNVKK